MKVTKSNEFYWLTELNSDDLRHLDVRLNLTNEQVMAAMRYNPYEHLGSTGSGYQGKQLPKFNFMTWRRTESTKYYIRSMSRDDDKQLYIRMSLPNSQVPGVPNTSFGCEFSDLLQGAFD